MDPPVSIIRAYISLDEPHVVKWRHNSTEMTTTRLQRLVDEAKKFSKFNWTDEYKEEFIKRCRYLNWRRIWIDAAVAIWEHDHKEIFDPEFYDDEYEDDNEEGEEDDGEGPKETQVYIVTVSSDIVKYSQTRATDEEKDIGLQQCEIELAKSSAGLKQLNIDVTKEPGEIRHGRTKDELEQEIDRLYGAESMFDPPKDMRMALELKEPAVERGSYENAFGKVVTEDKIW